MTADPGLGWHPDPADERDVTVDHPDVQRLLAHVGATGGEALPPTADLRSWFGPVADQGHLRSCTAHCATALFAYLQKRVHDRDIEPSRLFVYKAERNLLQWTGDRGAHLRTAMAALALVGAPEERYWPYDPAKVEDEPPAFCYAMAADFKALRYVRLDSADVADDAGALLERIRRFLAAGLPVAFGTPLFVGARLQSNANGGRLPFPSPSDVAVGGHAMTVVGYDDAVAIANADRGEAPTTGALLIRNSWGAGWGDQGYGWLPYAYVTRSWGDPEQTLASDWWALLSSGWINANDFGI